jgi:hypothetical protein
MGLSDFADLILHWSAHGRHVHPCSAMLASPADAEHHILCLSHFSSRWAGWHRAGDEPLSWTLTWNRSCPVLG